MPEMFEFSKPYQTIFTPDPGTVDEVQCSLCGSTATVHRKSHGPTSMSESMSGRGHAHDVFSCPLSDAEPDVSPWMSPPDDALHARVYHLQQEHKSTASMTLRKMFEKEIEELKSILRARALCFKRGDK